jgi:cytoskeletal protein RodZ
MSSYRERRGAHRPAGLGPAGTIPWLVAAVLVIGIVAYGLGWIGNGSGGDEAGPSTTPASTSSQHTSSSSKTTKSTSTTTSSPSTSTTSTSSSTSSTVDPTQQVTVLNGTRTPGLAASAAGKLRTAGWTIRSTGNYRGSVTGTTVFYGRAALQATAQAVAKDLGASAVRESADFGASSVTVVLASDYQQ